MTQRVLYHSAPPAARDSILSEGLHRRHSETAGIAREAGEPGWDSFGHVFLTDRPEENPDIDVWEVDASGLEVAPDDTTDCPNPGETWWKILGEGVPPSRLRLVAPAARAGMRLP